MNHRSLANATFAVGFVAATATAGLFLTAPPPGTVTIISTNDVQGRARRCGCQGPPGPTSKVEISTCSCKAVGPKPTARPLPDLGGLPERSAWLADVRARTGEPLQLDAGDLLFPRATPTDFERDEWRERAALIVEAYGLLGVRAWAPGELDLALGRGTLLELLSKARFRVLSANLADARTHERLFAPSATFDVGGRRVGVVGVFDPPPSQETSALLRREGLEALPLLEAVRPEVAALRAANVDLVVLLAHQPEEQSRALVRAVPGIDLVFGAHPEVPSDGVNEIEGTTAIVRTIPGGGAPLLARIKLAPGGRGVASATAALSARSWIERITKQVADDSAARDRATDPALRRQLDEQIAFARTKLEQYRSTLPAPHLHEVAVAVRAIEAAEWRQDWHAGLVAAIEAFKARVEKLELAPETRTRLEAAGVAPSGAPVAYATAAGCAACHEPQAAVWRASQHARAWASLERAGNQKDPDCVRCHSVGFREPGGFAEVRRAEHDGRDYRNVQCEACHGPMAGHPDAAGIGTKAPRVAACRRCHSGEHDPAFDEERRTAALSPGPKRVCTKER